MSLIVVGSTAIDTIETPAGKHEVLGGSSVYFAAAAHRYTPVRLVSVVGEDFPAEHLKFIGGMDVDTSGLVTEKGGETFRWHGRYVGAMNEAETIDVKLNVLGTFDPKVPESFRDSEYVFLANTHPQTQMKVIEQVRSPKLIVADTMNFWIESFRQDLDQMISKIDILCLNETEARMLTGKHGLAQAAEALMGLGLKAAVIKKGENGMTLATSDGVRALPAFPVTDVVDPTGAGDSFAGAMMGYLARNGKAEPIDLMRAAANGIAMASFTVGGFDPRHIAPITLQEVEARVEELRRICTF